MTTEEQCRNECRVTFDGGTVQRMLLIITNALLLMTVCLCFFNLKLYSDSNAEIKMIRERQVVNTERIAAMENWKNARQRQITLDAKK